MNLLNKIDAVKHELHARIRTRAASMSASQRARYFKPLDPELVEEIMRGVDAQPVVRPSASFAAFDQQWGLGGPSPRALTRTRHELVANAIAVPKARTPASQPPTAASSVSPRASAPVGRLTSHSPHAAEMDCRMGITPSVARVQRTRDSLVIG
jgi:hypothetical protein